MVNEKKEDTCAICNEPAKLKCSNCLGVWYCSKPHQKEHWMKHRNICRPYKIEYDETYGRYLVAIRDIKEGEVILKESPAVIGPLINSTPLCVACYRTLVPPYQHSCFKCKVAPVCNSCLVSNQNHLECNVLKKINDKVTLLELVENYQIIRPLRCLTLRDSNPDLWISLMNLESHLDKRRDTAIWRSHKINVEDVLTKYGLLSVEDLKNEIIQKICGILDVNSFEIRVSHENHDHGGLPNNCLGGLYLQAALMAHDCIANTHFSVNDDYQMIVRASLPITKGATIFFNYTSNLYGTHQRREHLLQGKYFECGCQRCSDPTELGTHMSSLYCPRCRKGFVVPANPLLEQYLVTSEWKCLQCEHKYKGIMIKSALNEAKRIIDELDKFDYKQMESALSKLSSTLSPHHQLMLDLKQSLIGAYTETIRKELNPNRKVLQRKIELCQDLIPILQKVEPGISRLKGITLYELHLPLVLLANRDLENKEITMEQYHKKLLESETALKEAIEMLLHEPSASPEGRLAAKAMGDLKMLRETIGDVEKHVNGSKQGNKKQRNKKKQR